MYYNDFSFVRYIYSENMLLTILETGMIVDEILPIENNLQFVPRANERNVTSIYNTGTIPITSNTAVLEVSPDLNPLCETGYH